MKKCLFPALVVLAACTANVSQPLPQMTFAQLHAIPISVSSINAHVISSKTGGAFIADPADAAQRYLNARFTPQGGPGTLEATIEEATVVKQQKESSNKVARWLNVANMDVYDVTLRIRFEHMDQGRLVYGKVLTARRRMNISEHASVAEREKTEFENLEKMFNDIDREVTNMVTEDMHLGMRY